MGGELLPNITTPRQQHVQENFPDFHLALFSRGSKNHPQNSGKRLQQVLNPAPQNPTPVTCHKRKTEVALQFSECCAAEVALQHSHVLQCGGRLYQKLRCSKRKNCIATLKQLHCRKVALSCRVPTDFRHPRLGSHV